MATTQPNSGRTIEEELGLQATKVDLGLQDEPNPVAVGEDQRFLVRRSLGQGSMGAVYLAFDERLGRDVALKVVPPHRLEQGQLQKRLEKEAKALAALRHDNVVQVHDLTTTQAGEWFIAMEYVPGENLRSWQKRKMRGVDEILDIYLMAGRGLAAAHERGVVHRDFKPDNVLIDEPDDGPRRVLVGDFGLAGADPEPDDGRPSVVLGLLTSSKGLMGTKAYMAPEQLRCEQAESRSDQHQFCVALWEAIACKRPFDAEDGRSLDPATPLPRRPVRMPRWIHRVLARGLAFERQERYPGMTQLLAALERGRRWRRIWPWLVAAGMLGLTGAAWWSALRPEPCDAVAAEVTAVWTTDIRRELDDVVRGAGTPYSDGLADYVTGGLDRATREWTAQARAVCEASEQSIDRQRRERCVEHATSRMKDVIGRLQSMGSESRSLARVHELVGSLWMPGDGCQRPAAPIDPQVQNAIDLAATLQLERRDPDALAHALAAVEHAAELGGSCSASGRDAEGRPYSRELAAALFRLGHVQRDQGAVADAVEALDSARRHASACEDGHRAADAWIHLAKIRTVDLRDVKAATKALEDAEIQLAVVEEPAETFRRHEQWKAAGLLAAQSGEWKTAREHYQLGLDAIGEPSKHPIQAARLLHDIGVAYQGEGQTERAREYYDRAVEVVTAVLGPKHPHTKERVAKRALSLALLALQQDRDDDARTGFAAVIRQGDATLTAKALTAWVELEYAVDAMQEAERLGRKLLIHVQAHPELRSPVVANAKSTTGLVMADLGRLESVGLLEDALQAWGVLRDEGAQQITRFYLARALHGVGRDDEALRELETLRRDSSVTRELREVIDDFQHSFDTSGDLPSTTLQQE